MVASLQGRNDVAHLPRGGQLVHHPCKKLPDDSCHWFLTLGLLISRKIVLPNKLFLRMASITVSLKPIHFDQAILSQCIIKIEIELKTLSGVGEEPCAKRWAFQFSQTYTKRSNAPADTGI